MIAARLEADYQARSRARLQASALAGAALLLAVAVSAWVSEASPSALAAQEALFGRPRPDRLLSFDVNWRPALWRGREEEGRTVIARFARRADVVFCSRLDAEAVWGTAAPEDVRALLPEPRYLLVTDHRGAVAFDGSERATSDALSVPVIETIGAGDAFGGAVCHGLLSGWPLHECARYGNAAGAIVAGRLMCADDMPTLAEIDAMERHAAER